jgi:hypothetical protein
LYESVSKEEKLKVAGANMIRGILLRKMTSEQQRYLILSEESANNGGP